MGNLSCHPKQASFVGRRLIKIIAELMKEPHKTQSLLFIYMPFLRAAKKSGNCRKDRK
jgi:hypothetical protein